ncbi:DNA-binding response regulator [Alicyclobacillus cellulosilyticus]|uniref:DNA-binding response regulator n=1 Tax=Alicyclobacillus cellulosilyticus TaxID=1003997 RepID=A0A917K9M6_9BACL|nr:response regulator transcription factor [Alicyclobacillus cellulosilyticus]GGJ03491.1 DNA-binding response regulator [Alicyclobacillus cellulosilyticus]
MPGPADTMTVLIVDDEPAIQTLVAYNFTRAGFVAETEADGLRAYERIREEPNKYRIVILDVMLPGLDGMEVCRRLRQDRIYVPIILLTARDEEIDRILGLEIGADDYVTKPFSPRELVARAKAVLRRVEAPPEQASPRDELVIGEVRMDLARHEVWVRGRRINLTPKEYELLQYFMSNPDRVLTRDQLLDRIWGYTVATDTRMVDVHVSHLREKIEADPKSPVYLRTVRGVGYKFSSAGPDGD